MDTAPASRRVKCGAAWWSVVLGLALWCANPVVASGALAPPAEAGSPGGGPAFEQVMRTAAWPPWLRGRRTLFGGPPPAPAVPDTPHPAVARIVVPEGDATAYGTGTLVDVRDQFGLVVTNWHVVRDSRGVVDVKFPNGFRSQARPLKVDSDWDLAALVIWRPPIEPVRVSQIPPRPGDVLTIHGYGQGQYRIATGRCTAFYAPKRNFPQEMVELNVEARQGDSGGPIFNDRGELAGVLFGAGEGTTIGSFAPRVETFLASLAPDIGAPANDTLIAVADRPAPEVHSADESEAEKFARYTTWPSSPWKASDNSGHAPHAASSAAIARGSSDTPVAWHDADGNPWFDRIKSTLAVVGMLAIALQLVRLVK